MKISIRAAALCLALFTIGLFPAPGRATQSYTLDKAVSTALERNFSIRSAREGLHAAEAARKSSRGEFGPRVSTGYDYQRLQHDMTPSGARQDPELFTWRAALTQNLFAGFSTLSSYQKAVLAKESAEAGVNKARLGLIRTVQEHFFAYLKAQEDVRSARDSLDRLRHQLASSKAFYESGLSPRLDVLQAEVDVSSAESALLVAQNLVDNEKARLNTLLVLPLDAPVEYVGDLDPVPFSRPLQECLDNAYARRPDLIIMEKAVGMAGKDVTLAQKDYYPVVDLFAGWSTVGSDFFASGSRYQENRFSGWSVGLTAEWTLFEWGTTFYKVRQARHEESRIRADAANLLQDVVYEVKARLLDMTDAAKRIRVARTGLAQATEAYRMAAARYKSQVGTMTDLLDAQAKLTLAETTLAGAKADYSIALSQLYEAMGEENIGLAPR